MKRRAAQASVVDLCERIDGARTGRIVAIDEQGRPLVDYLDNPHGPLAAALMRPIGGRSDLDARVGQEVVLLFRDSASTLPIIVGVVSEDLGERAAELVARVDGQRVVLEGQEEIVLQCGSASITLRSDGSVAIRGTTIESRSRFTNRIRGGTVEVN
jgi:hypothetical protein